MLKVKHTSLLTLSIVLIFNLLMVNYFYGFEQGKVEGGNSVRFIFKLYSLFLLLSIGSITFKKKYILRNIDLFIFFVTSSFLITLRIPFNDTRDLMFLNNLMALPLIIGKINDVKAFEKIISKVLILSILIWTVIDWGALILNLSLWENSAFIGGMGNPSTYGLLILYVYFTILIELKGLKKIVFSFILITNLLLTQALMPILVFLFIIFLKSSARVKILIVFGVILIVSQIENFLEILPDYHWKFKMQALIEFISNLDYTSSSASIYTRLEFFNQVLLLFEEPLTFLTGNVNRTYYNSGDSMYVTYLTSFGIPLFTLFICGLIRVLVNTYKTKYFFFVLSCCLLMLTNRILDYWPIAFLFYIIINLNQKLENEYRDC